ncbi:hypothetical protein [Bacillus salipaludis]|nr:hypothetical protein [Bacillus salipaludis]
MVKKVMVAGIGAVMLLGGVYGVKACRLRPILRKWKEKQFRRQIPILENG